MPKVNDGEGSTDVRIEFYLDAGFQTRWRAVRVGNNKIIGEGGEGYAEPRGAKAGFEILRKALQQGNFTISDVGRDSRSLAPRVSRGGHLDDNA